ncbi:myc-type, basic helix-loop-helix (bHLH) domain-containing protein [Artemisia annua]|uniref:Myc-type, basic helix-loop-helix (BHLH) domain-containing protein n=1 Tax=Artemisia annua TaxID=35608 RepID=A0A2U1L0C6_ARTAN|nr:myc-type, basic helix-loop-helix (bHLH) domain-containing protein [Artemisia annua]
MYNETQFRMYHELKTFRMYHELKTVGGSIQYELHYIIHCSLDVVDERGIIIKPSYDRKEDGFGNSEPNESNRSNDGMKQEHMVYDPQGPYGLKTFRMYHELKTVGGSIQYELHYIVHCSLDVVDERAIRFRKIQNKIPGIQLFRLICPNVSSNVKLLHTVQSHNRRRSNSCSRAENKACRERQRREKLNERFVELSSTLEPDWSATTDKLAIIGDVIRVLNQLKAESQECKNMNEKILEEIKTFRQQVKTMTNNHLPPPGFMSPHPAAYQAVANKMPIFSGYGYIPMWEYLPQTMCDTSHDQELRPPAA